MATDGTPDPFAKRCGKVIAELRQAKELTRSQLINRLFDELEPDEPNYDSISESWLARLEKGRMVKVSRSTLDALLRALRCTAQERARVLFLADRNVLTIADEEEDDIAELLNYAMFELNTEARVLLASLLKQRRMSELDKHEVFELIAKALELVIRHRRRQ